MVYIKFLDETVSKVLPPWMDASVRRRMMVLHLSSIRRCWNRLIPGGSWSSIVVLEMSSLISVGLVTSFFHTRPGICNEDSTFTSNGVVFGDLMVLLFLIYHLGFYVMQESFRSRWICPSINTVRNGIDPTNNMGICTRIRSPRHIH